MTARPDSFAWPFRLQSGDCLFTAYPPGDPTMIVFITGASAGFGAAMARTFVKNGHQVVLAARRKAREMPAAMSLHRTV